MPNSCGLSVVTRMPPRSLCLGEGVGRGRLSGFIWRTQRARRNFDFNLNSFNWPSKSQQPNKNIKRENWRKNEKKLFFEKKEENGSTSKEAEEGSTTQKREGENLFPNNINFYLYIFHYLCIFTFLQLNCVGAGGWCVWVWVCVRVGWVWVCACVYGVCAWVCVWCVVCGVGVGVCVGVCVGGCGRVCRCGNDNYNYDYNCIYIYRFWTFWEPVNSWNIQILIWKESRFEHLKIFPGHKIIINWIIIIISKI